MEKTELRMGCNKRRSSGSRRTLEYLPSGLQALPFFICLLAMSTSSIVVTNWNVAQYVAITWEDVFDGEIVRVGRFVIQQVFETSLPAGQTISQAVGFDFHGCLELLTRDC